MIKRSNRFGMIEILKNKPWTVVDLGCGTTGACPRADVLVDRNDHSSKFPNKKFVIHDVNNLPALVRFLPVSIAANHRSQCLLEGRIPDNPRLSELTNRLVVSRN